MGGDAGEREGGPGLWFIQFTACDGDQAREHAEQGACGDGALEVAVGGRYGFAAVGTHQQVIALRDVVMSAGESFAITRAIMAELHPHGQLLFYEGGDPGGLPRAGQDAARSRPPLTMTGGRSARQPWCPAGVLDVVLAGYGEWPLRRESGRTEEG